MRVTRLRELREKREYYLGNVRDFFTQAENLVYIVQQLRKIGNYRRERSLLSVS